MLKKSKPRRKLICQQKSKILTSQNSVSCILQKLLNVLQISQERLDLRLLGHCFRFDQIRPVQMVQHLAGCEDQCSDFTQIQYLLSKMASQAPIRKLTKKDKSLLFSTGKQNIRSQKTCRKKWSRIDGRRNTF